MRAELVELIDGFGIVLGQPFVRTSHFLCSQEIPPEAFLFQLESKELGSESIRLSRP
jgi:hypothetical protein